MKIQKKKGDIVGINTDWRKVENEISDVGSGITVGQLKTKFKLK